jgi:hypothetical protein
MEEFKEFLINYWQFLASGVLFIIATVIGIVRMKKKGMTFQEILSGILMEQIPLWISMSETTGGSGEQKKVAVLNKALNYCSSKLGRQLSETESQMIISYVSEKIETVLATPQKKGVAKKAR